MGEGKWTPEQLATMREAAPELYEALERITRVASVELAGKRDDVLDQCHAAIAKVRGAQP